MEKPETRKSIKRILNYVKKSKLNLCITIILATISVLASLVIPKFIGNAIDLIVSKGRVDFESLIPILLIIFFAILVSAVCQWLMSSVTNQITYSVTKQIRNDAFTKIQKLPLSYLDKHQTGETISKMITDVEQFADGLLLGFSQLFTGAITIIGTITLMLALNPLIAAIVIVLTPLSFFVAKFIAKKTYNMFVLQSTTRGEQTAFIEEVIGNQKLVKAYNREEKVVKDFDEINDRLEKASLDSIFYSSTTNPSTRFINNIIYAMVTLFGAIFALSGGISIGMLSCFLSYATQYTKPFNEISGVIAEFQNALACANRVFDLLDEDIETGDLDELVTIENPDGNISFSNVNFSYTKEKELIKNLSFKANKGQKVAIVGPTGAGKTTLINIIMRFYNVDSGDITLDDHNIYEITKGSLRESIGMVLQDTWLKTGSVKDNIRIGKPDATDEEVIEAAKNAHCHSFIKRLPNGYDTIITEDNGLSQGEKQLLCIARLMINTPPILILDEATSSIDTRTEIKIQKAFNTLMEGRTTFIVAHRLSTIVEADLILVMKDGQIVEQGKHQELLNKNGFYSKLYNSQYVEIK